MLARIQRALVTFLLFSVLTWVGVTWTSNRPGWTLAGIFVLPLGYGFFLAVEMLWMRLSHGVDPAPRPTAYQMLVAWSLEWLAGPRVFGWRQPFRSRRWPDQLGQGAMGRRGVLLIHGFVCNRGLWNAWMQRLTSQGTPFVAVNLEPVFGSIDEYVGIIEQAVARLEAATGLPPLVVAHSMGGLALRRWAASDGRARRLHHAITLGTPHEGTRLAACAFPANARQMRRASGWLQRLQADEEHPSGQGLAERTTCFYSHTDNIVFPASSAAWQGARHRHLLATPHVHMADHAEPWQEAMGRLAPERKPPSSGEV